MMILMKIISKYKPKYNIAAKAVDNEGLEAIEVLKIKVNGVVERE